VSTQWKVHLTPEITSSETMTEVER